MTFVPTEARGRAPHEAFLTTPVTILSGTGVLAPFTVLGMQTSSHKFVAYDDDGTNDGRQTASLILAEKVDATSADVQCAAYIRGVFDKSKLIGLDDAGIADFVTHGGRDMPWTGEVLL